jgi:hypothetical protein
VALKWLEEHAYAQAQFLEEDPHWDDRGYQWLEQYQEALLGGMREGGKKAVNMNKTSEVLQGLDENSSQFYKHLCEAFCLYTPFDLEATENQEMINGVFVGQGQGNVR